MLELHGLIARETGRSTYRLCNYDLPPWGKLPAKHLYASNDIVAFRHLHLRRPAELDALKLYYLLVAFRDNATNQTYISYDKISGIERGNIKRGQSLLVTHDLIHVDYAPSSISERGVKNSYRLIGADSNRHMGTTGRRLLSEEHFLEADE